MKEESTEGLDEVTKSLAIYIERGHLGQFPEQKREYAVQSKVDRSKFKPLRRLSVCEAKFAAVDCSTRTLKRANNWGVYLLRTVYASVKKREVDWGYREEIATLLGPAYSRFHVLRNLRLEAESRMALERTKDLDSNDYLLLDGSSYFGEKTGFHVSLFEECKTKNVVLLALSKQSPTLLDELGRDFQVTAQLLAQQPTWVYHPVAKANLNEHLYGDISLIKLCCDSPRVFRCDIMEYLSDRDPSEVISPLTAICEDPRCLGYPVALFLAHEFSAPSDSMLLHYYEKVEDALKKAGLYDRLHREELSCSFADELHGMKYPFEREMIDYV